MAASYRKVIDVLGKYVKESRLERMKHVLNGRTRHVQFCLENVEDPHNVAAIFRTCDGFGMQYVHLLNSWSSGSSHVKDVAKGSEKWITQVHHADVQGFLQHVQSCEGTLVSTEVGGSSVESVAWSSLPRPLFFVLGNETRGVSRTLRTASRVRLGLPSHGMVQSYNVSVAAAVLASSLLSAGALSHPHQNPESPDSLPEDEKLRIMARWLVADVPAASVILKRFDATPQDF